MQNHNVCIITKSRSAIKKNTEAATYCIPNNNQASILFHYETRLVVNEHRRK